jgi:hypothetical protein
MVIHWLLSIYTTGASSNLAYLGHGTGNTLGYLVKTFGPYLYRVSHYLRCT